ncbi:LOW QUALITY PROTEIN: mitochondrial potassium channel-like [Amphiura filiformis]|uniref:LOW QUALITY PROTEIN: mitochondrial potassium channel-like n=1 Tax=Amphiura filiformis TaxID=82378 RepID=UPI003B21FB00
MISNTCVRSVLRNLAARNSMILYQHSRLRPNVGDQSVICLTTTTLRYQKTTNLSNSTDMANKKVSVASSTNQPNGMKEKLVEKMTTGRVGELVSAFEEFLGIGDVKRAQSRLIELEGQFLDARKDVKKASEEVTRLQGELRIIRAKLDRTPREDPHFLELATEEHHLLKTETRQRELHDRTISEERSIFQEMGIALRDSYEKQRVHEERSKYWSLMLGLTTGIIAFRGSTIVNYRKMRTLQTLVLDQISAITGDKPVEEGTNLGTALENLSHKHNASLEAQTKTFQDLLAKQEDRFAQELGRITGREPGGVEEMLNENQAKLEWEVKMSTLSTVVLIYGAFALTLPILYTIFK